MSYAESWGGILSRHVQFRCKICPDGVGEFADVVCADAWECDDRGYPVFEEAEGVSLVLSRTALGERLIDRAMAAGALRAQPYDMAQLPAMQLGQTRRRRSLAARLAALAMTGLPAPRYRGFALGRAAREAGPRGLAKEFLGLVRRAVTGRLD